MLILVKLGEQTLSESAFEIGRNFDLIMFVLE